MTSIALAVLPEVDEQLEKRLKGSRALLDHLVGKAGSHFLLATTRLRASYDGIKPLQLTMEERVSEDLVALISEHEVDYSLAAYRIYADPFNTESLVSDSKVSDGFIIEADRMYDIPEECYRLLAAIRAGARVKGVFRRGGEASAAMDDRIFLARCGPYHPRTQEVLSAFDGKGRGAKKLHTLAFNVRAGSITVDNTFKPKTVKLAKK